MKIFKGIGLIVLTVLVFIAFSYGRPIVYGGVGGGLSRYWDSNSLQKYIGANCGVGFQPFFSVLGITFDYDFDYYFPIKARDCIREYHVNYHDCFISCNLLFLKNTNIQVGVGSSFINSHIEFLRDTIISEFPFNSVLYHKGDTYSTKGSIGFSCKLSVWYGIPRFGNHFQLYCKIKAKSAHMGPVVTGIYGYYAPHLPFHLSLGIIFKS